MKMIYILAVYRRFSLQPYGTEFYIHTHSFAENFERPVYNTDVVEVILFSFSARQPNAKGIASAGERARSGLFAMRFANAREPADANPISRAIFHYFAIAFPFATAICAIKRSSRRGREKWRAERASEPCAKSISALICSWGMRRDSSLNFKLYM